MGLKFKVFIGYSILIALLAFIVYLFRQEQIKWGIQQKDEREMVYIRKLVEKTYVHLWELTAQAEQVSVWNKVDLDRYCAKRREVCDTLQVLKDCVHIPNQKKRIDSLCLILQEKESLLSTVMNTFLQLEDVGDLIREKIPVIVSQMKHASKNNKTVNNSQSSDNFQAKRGFWSIFHKRKSKSAYLKQREKDAEEKTLSVIPVSSSTRLLYSLDKEVMEQQRKRQQKLLQQMDSLYRNNLVLNRKLDSLIRDFETEANLNLTERHRRFISDRENSFFTFVGFASFICLLILILYIIIYWDVKRQYRYRQKLEASNKENLELLAARKKMMLSIAHDLRSPLAAIKGCAELLHGEEEGSRKDEYAETILHSSDYMIGLVNTLIEFYLLDTGKNKPNISIFRLDTLFKEITINYSSLAEKRKLQLITDFSGLSKVVSGERSQLLQILNNLLSNAIKFTRKGEIRLRAEYLNNELHFSVHDTGTGMTGEEQERIFAAFERLDNACNIPGFGLGLAIVGKLVSGMQGTITVKSKLGQGSTFTIFLPFPKANEATRIEETSMVTNYHLNEACILVIDDDQIQLNITKEMLHRNGVRCDCCQTSRELITRLRSQKYDLLLTDIQMPETDGYGILELLRASNMENAKTMPVVAVTARVDDGSEYFSYGFSGCIHKPFSIDELMDVVAKVIGEKDNKEHEPDFSLILSGEDNRTEMLGLFIEESRKDLAILIDALEQQDKITAASILHKNLPLWETVRLDFPLSHLRELLTNHTTEWTNGQSVEIQDIIHAVGKLIEYAQKIREEDL